MLKLDVTDMKKEVDRLIGHRPTDAVARREANEESKSRQLDMLNHENKNLEEEIKEMQKTMFETEEKNLDLRFKVETFDIQYSRLQKRIADLEGYKLHASQISANNKKQHEEDIKMIKEDTEKLRGDSLNKQPGESVKLRTKKHRTVPELEELVD